MKNLIKCLFLGLIAVSICGCGDSGSKKWRLDNKNLTKNELELLKEHIAIRNEIDQKKQWEDLDGDDWAQLLIFFPEEAKRCRELKGFEKFGLCFCPTNPNLKKNAKKIAALSYLHRKTGKMYCLKMFLYPKKFPKATEI